MKLASHNSWSYLKPKHWWMYLLKFTAQCQDKSISTQYDGYGVRCFDLRVKFKDGNPVIVHNIMEYDYFTEELERDLKWLNSRKDVAIRVILDIRSKKKYTSEQKGMFVDFCFDLEKDYPHIKFWCGKGMYDRDTLYKFKYSPTCEEKYSSVTSPKLLDDWFPRIYAKLNNHKLLEKRTEKDYLMIDFVNYR